MPISTTADADPNQHVREYLTYYIGLQRRPRYAVMLSGRWGVGKTHQVKKVLKELQSYSGGTVTKPYVLVSLYGLKSPEEIDDAMVAALHPWGDNDGVRIATSVAKALLKHKTGWELPKVKSSDLINRMSTDVFVFDDLERCGMPVTDTFGYINQLVERDGCKVIVLANQDEIKDQAEYLRGKEKLIGKTLEVEPDFDAAFSDFLTDITDQETRTFYQNLPEEIRDVYDQSALKNLRILQQTMWDFERVYKALDQEHRSNDNAMRHLLRLFFALCFECKTGALSPDDFRARSQQSFFDAVSHNENPSPFTVVAEKYPGLYFYDSILTDEVVTDIFVRGVVDRSAITSSLNASSWFVSVNEPSWRTVWYSSERADADVQAAATSMIDEFKNRKYKLTGEMLHLFGQMLFLADMSFSGRDRFETLADCKLYVDDLRESLELESPKEPYLDDIRHGSYGGLGFEQNDTVEFRELWQYVGEQRAAAEVDRYPYEAMDLVTLMGSDPTSFVRQITYNNEGGAQFANRPVLAAADVENFAGTLIGLEPMAFREVLLGLSSRYDMAKLANGRELSEEREWVVNLESALRVKTNALEPFAHDRISKNVEWTLGKRLRELTGNESEQAER